MYYRFCLHSLEELGLPKVRRRALRIKSENEKLLLRKMANKILEEAQSDIRFVKIFQRPFEEDTNRIQWKEGYREGGDAIREMSSKNGDKYRFETYNSPFAHETKVFRNGEFVIVFPIGFYHNYNYTRFCEWVMEVFFWDFVASVE